MSFDTDAKKQESNLKQKAGSKSRIKSSSEEARKAITLNSSYITYRNIVNLKQGRMAAQYKHFKI